MADNKKKEQAVESPGKVWATRIKVLLISGILASIANMIYDWRTGAEVIHMPWEVFPALLYIPGSCDSVCGTDHYDSKLPVRRLVCHYNADRVCKDRSSAPLHADPRICGYFSRQRSGYLQEAGICNSMYRTDRIHRYLYRLCDNSGDRSEAERSNLICFIFNPITDYQ